MSIVIVQILNGLTLGLLLSIIAIGLTIIFGFMGVVNFAHGSFYMLSAYIAYSVIKTTGSFWIALVIAPCAVSLLGFLFQRVIIENLPTKDGLSYILVTYGFALVIENILRIIWGTSSFSIDPPAILAGPTEILQTVFPAYRLFLNIFVLFICGLIYWIIFHTRFGLQIRAETEDSEMAMAIGIRSKLLSFIVFAIGIFLAGLAGVLAGPYQSLHHTMGLDVLTYAFIIVVIAGMRSYLGTIASGIFVALVLTVGNIFFPSLAIASVYLIMIVVLIYKPVGLFGKRGA